MYDRILFPTDGSEGANAVFDHVLELAADHGATIHILYVADTTHDSVTRIGDEVVDVLEHEGEQVADEIAERAMDRHVTTVTDVLQGRVPETIVTYAEEHDVDLIAMPTHGRTGLERVILGSVTERVIRTGTVPVLTLRPETDRSNYPYENVLVPTDGSDAARKALERAVDIVTATGATLHLLSVVNVGALDLDHGSLQIDALQDSADEILEEASAVAEESGVDSIVTTSEVGGSVFRTIQAYVDEADIDLVVMGTQGRTGLDRFLLGSVAAKTVRTATVPVMTVQDPTNGH